MVSSKSNESSSSYFKWFAFGLIILIILTGLIVYKLLKKDLYCKTKEHDNTQLEGRTTGLDNL